MSKPRFTLTVTPTYAGVTPFTVESDDALEILAELTAYLADGYKVTLKARAAK